jgi:hypothetical protein
MPDAVWALVPIAGMATGSLFMVGVYKLVTRWMDLRARREQVGAGPEALHELRRGVEALRALPERVAELEERIDFAERLLAKERERGALRAGS